MLILPPENPEVQHPFWEFSEITLGERTYWMRIRWNSRAERWHLDIASLDGTRKMYGKRLVPNYPIGKHHTGRRPDNGFLLLLDTADPSGREPCTYEGLGHRWKLLWLEPEDLAELAEAEPPKTYTITVP